VSAFSKTGERRNDIVWAFVRAKARGFPQTRQHSATDREGLMPFSRSMLVTAVLVTTQSTIACAQATQTAPAPSPQPAVRSQLSDLGFMAGCWRGLTRSGTTIEEFYTTPSSNLIVGTTRYVRDGRTVDFEFTRIDQTDSGAVITPHPKGVRSVSFAPKTVERNRAVWENPTHDFPQRILYTRAADDTLVARIEGRTPSGDRALEWQMVRVSCEALPRVP
jgi:hypothetical protein